MAHGRLFGSQSDVNSRFTESIGNLIASSQDVSVFKLGENGDDHNLNLDEELFEHDKMKVIDQVVLFENGSAADITEQELAELNDLLDNHDLSSEAGSDRNNETHQEIAESLTTTPTLSISSIEVTSGSESEGEENRPLKRKRRPSYVFAAGMINPTKDQLKQARHTPYQNMIEEEVVAARRPSNREHSNCVHSNSGHSSKTQSSINEQTIRQEEKDEVENIPESGQIESETRSNEQEETESSASQEVTAEEVKENEKRLASLEQQLAEMEELERKVQKVQKYGDRQGSSDGGSVVDSNASSSQVLDDDQDDLINSLSHVARVRKQFQGNKSPPTKARSKTRSIGRYSPNTSLSSLEEETFFDHEELQDVIDDDEGEDLGASMPNIDLSEPAKPTMVSPLAQITRKASNDNNHHQEDSSSSSDDEQLPLAVKDKVPVHHAKIRRASTQEQLELLDSDNEEDLQLPLEPTTDSQHEAKKRTTPTLNTPPDAIGTGDHDNDDNAIGDRGNDAIILPLPYTAPPPAASKKRKATPAVGGGISDHARYKIIRQQQLKTESAAVAIPSPPLQSAGSLSNSRSDHMDMISEED